MSVRSLTQQGSKGAKEGKHVHNGFDLRVASVNSTCSGTRTAASTQKNSFEFFYRKFIIISGPRVNIVSSVILIQSTTVPLVPSNGTGWQNSLVPLQTSLRLCSTL